MESDVLVLVLDVGHQVGVGSMSSLAQSPDGGLSKLAVGKPPVGSYVLELLQSKWCSLLREDENCLHAEW